MAFIDWIIDQFGQMEAHPISTLKCPDLLEPIMNGSHLVLLTRWQPQLPCCCYSTCSLLVPLAWCSTATDLNTGMLPSMSYAISKAAGFLSQTWRHQFYQALRLFGLTM